MFACQEEVSNDYETVDLERKLVVNIDYIKSISKEGFTDFDIDGLHSELDDLNSINDAITLDAIEDCNVGTNSNWSISADYNELKAYEWDLIQNNFCFTFVQWHDDCCLSMYCCVLANDGRVKSISSFGTSGGDGGWSTITEGELTHPGTYHIYADEFEIDYVDNDGEGMEIETQSHVEYFLRFKDSIFVKGEIINDFTATDTFVMELGC